MAVRKHRQVETRMVSEYVVQEYAQFPVIQRVPLGKISEALLAEQGTAKAIKYSRPFRPEVDAVVILPQYLVLIEAKVWQVMNGLGKLPMYKSLVQHTPELRPYLPRDIILELVVARTDSNLEIMARDAGIRLKVYLPEWLQEVIAGLNVYWTKAYHEKRQDTLALREYFGVD